MKIEEVLATIPIFATLEGEELGILKGYVEQKTFQAGAVIFREKDPGDALYIVAKGGVRITKDLDGKNSVALAGFVENDFFGELALLDGSPRSADAIAARPTVLLSISNENFHRLMQAAPFTALKIISQIACHLSIRLRQATAKIAELENWRLLRK
jgi:CRP-like cAMP-binding protein